jgi:hypothetical protein
VGRERADGRRRRGGGGGGVVVVVVVRKGETIEEMTGSGRADRQHREESR